MNLLMPRQLIAPRERLAALVARVPLLPLVRPDMLGEVGRFGEGRGAAGVRAEEGFVAGVDAWGESQLGVERETRKNYESGW